MTGGAAIVLIGLASVNLASTIVPAGTQQSPAWAYTKQSDELHAKDLDTFALTGSYDVAAARPSGSAPEIKVSCSNGKFQQAYLQIDAVAGYSGTSQLTGASESRVELRIDERKPDTDYWQISNDGTALFFGNVQLSKLLTGSMIGHPSDPSKLTKRVLIGVVEGFGNEILVRFNMPANVDELVLKCGLEYDRKRKKELEARVKL